MKKGGVSMKHDSSTISWNQLGREWFELAQTGEREFNVSLWFDIDLDCIE